MAKISPVSAKYIIHASINIEGVVDRPDVIGAIFGQTEGLLGSELELRELQRSGRIGRIEVGIETRNGKSGGSIIVPSSLDKAETSIIGAALEIIQRIGPCNAKVKVEKIEDIRVSKRHFVIERAKELLKELMEGVLPDSQELADEVTYSVRIMEIQKYGRDRLPAGPSVDDSDEIIVVEGRADILNLLKHGFKNCIALNGTSVPETIIELSKKKVLTVFVDGDRGGNLILKEILNIADVDYVTKAPDGKEVEEITKKEIHKALRSRISGEQARLELDVKPLDSIRPKDKLNIKPLKRPEMLEEKEVLEESLKPEERKIFREMSEELFGTRGAYILDKNLQILGKVPISELQTTVKSLNSVYAVVFDGVIDTDLIKVAEKTNLQYIIGMDSKLGNADTKVTTLTVAEL